MHVSVIQTLIVLILGAVYKCLLKSVASCYEIKKKKLGMTYDGILMLSLIMTKDN